MRIVKSWLWMVVLAVSLVAVWRFAISPLIFSSPERALVALGGVAKESNFRHMGNNQNASCLEFESASAIDHDGQLRVTSWNIYKQQNPGWDELLLALTERSDLSLLQEVSLSPSFTLWLRQNQRMGQQASAFEVFEKSSGVFNLSERLPHKICALFENEPWLQLPKSALFATYRLSNGEELWAANIHGVNFTVGTEELERQMVKIEKALALHNGPVIFAGDFNAWREDRVEEMLRVMKRLGLQEVRFTPDIRTEFTLTGYPLDYIFYRGLEIKKAEVIATSASDHYPLWVEFSLPK